MKKIKYLTLNEVAQLMGVPLVTVSRWVHQGKIPCKQRSRNFVFKKNEIVSWARSHNFQLSPEVPLAETESKNEKISLSQSISKGGIFYQLKGNDIYSVLKNAVDKIYQAHQFDSGQVLNELIKREEIASTGIGKGIAIPHPRRPMDLSLEYPVIPVFFLKNEIDFNSVDHKPVFVLFLIFTPSTRIHLHLLSRLSFCLREKNFLNVLQTRPDKINLLAEVSKIEKKFSHD